MSLHDLTRGVKNRNSGAQGIPAVIEDSVELVLVVDRLAFPRKDNREIPLVSQGKRNHNICDVRLDCGSEVLQEYRLK